MSDLWKVATTLEEMALEMENQQVNANVLRRASAIVAECAQVKIKRCICDRPKPNGWQLCDECAKRLEELTNGE